MENGKEIKDSWRVLTDHQHESLRFVTVIIGVLRVSEIDAKDKDRTEVLENKVRDMVIGFQHGWRQLITHRKIPADLIWRGRFEFDLFRDVGAGSKRWIMIRDFISPDDTPELGANERWLSVHVHIVVGNVRDDKTLLGIAAYWRGKMRTDIKRLYSHQTTSEAITNICNYCHKNKLQYSTGGLDNVPTKFGKSFGLIFGRFVTKMYNSIYSDFNSK